MNDQTTERQLKIYGMTCASCVNRLQKSLSTVAGVTAVSVNMATDIATLQVRPEVTPNTLVIAIRGARYEVQNSEPTRPCDPYCSSGGLR